MFNINGKEVNSLETNIVINGNSLVELKKIEDNSIDLIFADPPYWMRTEGVLHRVEGTEFAGCDDEWDQFETNEDYEQFTKEWLEECYRVLKQNGSIWVIGGMQCIYTIGGIMQQIGYWFINDVIWHKKNPTPNFKGTRLNNSHETLIWATKSKKSKYTFHYKTAKELNDENVTLDEFEKGVRKQLGSVWRFSVCAGNERLKDKEGNKLHNTQKPLQMLERIIAISSNKDDVILDPFAGTMTTGVAAKKLGRHYIMIEREEKYCHYGEQRLDETEYEPSDIANASYDIKPIKVTVPEMIEKKFFIEGETFYLKNKEPVATLLSNGKLLYNGEELDMHTCVARAKNAKSNRLNGFDYWYVKRGEDFIKIADIRENYRETIKKEL